MATFAEVQAEIANDLARTDLTAEIAQAVLDAIEHHSTERFWFNETRDYTFPTVAGTAEYEIAPASGLQDFIEIDFVKRLPGTTLRRIRQDEYDAMDVSSSTGQPSQYSYFGATFFLYPTPDAAYTIRVGGQYRLVPLAAADDSSIWTTTARNLIRSTSKLLVGANIIHLEGDELSTLSQLENAALDRLRRETRRRKGAVPLRTDLAGIAGRSGYDINVG